MKVLFRTLATMLIVCLLGTSVRIEAAEVTSVNKTVDCYFQEKTNLLITGKTSKLKQYAVTGIVKNEKSHYSTLEEKGIKIQSSTVDIVDVEYGDDFIVVSAKEKITYTKNGKKSSEKVTHDIELMYSDSNELIVVSDGYAEKFAMYESASYVNVDTVARVTAAGSDSCIIHIAESQVGYCEKETNENLYSFTDNKGDKNYTKYGKWYGQNGVPWCAIFVSWCANQCGVSASIIKKEAGCDQSMNFFKGEGRFHKSAAYGGTYTPKPGDIFFTGPVSTDAQHTGFVKSVSGTTITVIDGNHSNRVCERIMSLKNTSLLGFASPKYASSTHTYEWKGNSIQHWKKCEACGLTKAKANHTWVKNKTYYTCSGCGVKKSLIESEAFSRKVLTTK